TLPPDEDAPGDERAAVLVLLLLVLRAALHRLRHLPDRRRRLPLAATPGTSHPHSDQKAHCHAARHLLPPGRARASLRAATLGHCSGRASPSIPRLDWS